jgi:hypothetical protein
LLDDLLDFILYEFGEEDVNEMYAALATTNAWQKALEAEASQPEYGVKKKKGKITKKQGKKKKQFFSKVFGSNNRVGAVLTQARASCGM